MPTYRVSIRRPTTQPPMWDWMQTVVARSADIAIGWSYADWVNSGPIPPAPALGLCQTQARPVGLTQVLASDTAPATTSSQQAFAKGIEDKVGTLLAAKLDGQFRMVNYPAGFNYGITYGSNAYWNQATLQDIDTLVGLNDAGLPDLTGSSFSNLYQQVLSAVTFSFSTADNATIAKQDTNASNQIASVLTEFTNAGGTFSNPLPFGGKLQDVFNQLSKQYGSIANLPTTLNALRNAIASYQSAAGDSYALHNRYYAATARIAAAQANVVKPTASNGGMQVDATNYYVGYTPNKLPTAVQLFSGLQDASNAVDISIDMSSFSSNSANVSVNGNAGVDIPILDLLTVSVSGSAAYDMSRYTSSSTNLTVELHYPGVTLFGSQPSVLSADASTGWYANDILQEVAANSGQDATGYTLQGTEYSVDELFGENGAFARLKTFVISQQPTMTLTFEAAEVDRISSDFEVDASVQVDLFGLFNIGGASASYKVQSVNSDSKAGTVTVTFGPPPLQGTVPTQQQVAYVLGGVESRPPQHI